MTRSSRQWIDAYSLERKKERKKESKLQKERKKESKLPKVRNTEIRGQ